MKRLIIVAIATIAVTAAVTTALRSHSIRPVRAAATTAMPSVQELAASADTSKLPVQEFKDHSLVYPE
jgi:hypothetical protein